MILDLILLLLTLVQFLVLARVLMSWVNVNPHENDAARIIHELTEPILAPIRDLMPQAGMIDFSPLILFLLISMVQQALISAA